MELPPLLLADGFDTFLQLAFFFLFFLGPALLKLFLGGGKQQPKQPPVPNQGGGPRNVPLPPPAPPGPPAAQPEDRLEREIEEFLRKARGDREVVNAEATRPLEADPVRSVVANEPIIVAESIDQPLEMDHSSVAEHVTEHINSRSVSEHARHLGQRVQTEVDSIESRVHQIFDHDLGQLDKASEDSYADVDERGTDSQVWEGTASRQKRSDDARQQRSDEIFRMIRDPASVKTAVILAEILRRPNF